MKYKDQLVVTGKLNDVGAYTRTNIGNSYRTGIELQGAGQIFKRLKASANLTLSRNKVKNFTEYIDDNDNGGQKMMAYKQSDISFSPAVISAATLSLSIIKNLNLNLINKYVGKQYLDNTSNENRKLSLYATQDFRVNYAILGKKIKQLDLIIQVGNFWNKMYEPSGSTYSYYSAGRLSTDNYYSPMAGINYMLAVNISL
ncbi:MAG: hypothetical protein NVS9B7_05570 [Flavisolibacter sp.]